MKLIPLTKGLFAKVDDDRYDELIQYSWHASGLSGKEYAARRTTDGEDASRRYVYMHQQVLHLLDRPYTGLHVDHDDRDRLNNQEYNLIVKTPSGNQLNSERVDKSKGVGYDSLHNRFKAYIGSGATRVNVGTFKTYDEAVAAREKFMRAKHETLKKED